MVLVHVRCVWLCRSGSEVCNTTPLMEVNCSAGYEERSGGCVTIPAASTSPLQLIMGLGDVIFCSKNGSLTVLFGAGVGVVLALCVIILLVLIRKHPSRAKKIFLSFMRKAASKQNKLNCSS